MYDCGITYPDLHPPLRDTPHYTLTIAPVVLTIPAEPAHTTLDDSEYLDPADSGGAGAYSDAT
jgi:hypothetical protein